MIKDENWGIPLVRIRDFFSAQPDVTADGFLAEMVRPVVLCFRRFQNPPDLRSKGRTSEKMPGRSCRRGDIP